MMERERSFCPRRRESQAPDHIFIYEAFAKYVNAIELLMEGLAHQGILFMQTRPILDLLDFFQRKLERRIQIGAPDLAKKGEMADASSLLQMHAEAVAEKIESLKQRVGIYAKHLSPPPSARSLKQHSFCPSPPWLVPPVRLQMYPEG